MPAGGALPTAKATANDFVTEDGGCKDLDTGLVWSSDTYSAGSGTSSRLNSEELCDDLIAAPEGGGYTDWRLPTLGEMESAIANGLNDHLDFFYPGNFPDDFPEWDGPDPVDHRYRWLLCSDIIDGTYLRIRYHMASGAYDWLDNSSHSAVCVRGLPYDLELDCPPCECSGLRKKDRDKCLAGVSLGGIAPGVKCIPGADGGGGGPGNGGGKGKNASLSVAAPQVMIASLLMPLALVVVGGRLRRRRV